jgi:hypothetical protein
LRVKLHPRKRIIKAVVKEYMDDFKSHLDAIGKIIDSNTEAKGVSWLSEAHAGMSDSSEIMLLHKKTEYENDFTVREYSLRQGTPHKQARFSERKWSGVTAGDAIDQRSRRVFPALRLEIEHIGFNEFDVIWAARRVGRLLENKAHKKFETVRGLVSQDG